VDRSEALLAIAQIALGLAGFGGVFVAVGGGRSVTRAPADSYRLFLLQSVALSTLVLSLLPVAFQGLGASEDTVWRLASALLAILISGMLIGSRRLRRPHEAEIRVGEQRAVARLIWAASVVFLAVQLPNVIGVFGERAFGVFFSALVFLVAFGSYLFARMLFLWRG
jgi:hypothetical protein